MKITVDSYKNYAGKLQVALSWDGRGYDKLLTREEAEDLHAALGAVLATDAAFPENNVGKGFPTEGSQR